MPAIRAAWRGLTYTYLHLFLVAGVILAAVGDEFVLAHASDIAGGKTLAAVLGGAGLFLLGIALFKWSITGRMPVSPYLAIIALLLMIPLHGRVSATGRIAGVGRRPREPGDLGRVESDSAPALSANPVAHRRRQDDFHAIRPASAAGTPNTRAKIGISSATV